MAIIKSLTRKSRVAFKVCHLNIDILLKLLRDNDNHTRASLMEAQRQLRAAEHRFNNQLKGVD